MLDAPTYPKAFIRWGSKVIEFENAEIIDNKINAKVCIYETKNDIFNEKVLVVVAHPDDEVLGCGGTIIKHKQANDKVKIIFLADGISSRKNNTNFKEIELEGNMQLVHQKLWALMILNF